MTKQTFRKGLFFSADEWLSSEDSELLDDSEVHWLHTQAKLAREALEAKLEEVMKDES